MDLDNLKIVSALAILVTVEAYTIASDFNYTVCKWYNSRCEPFDATEFITLIENNATSEWPPGPFALLTTNEGCPESSASGWRRGYLSFTWKRPQTLTLVNDSQNCHDQSYDENTLNASNTTSPYRCLRNLTRHMAPNRRIYLLGPFSKYALRLNFCSKIENSSIIESENTWPVGSYSVFSDGGRCPAGFTISERTIKLPAIMAWTSNGHLPSFSVKMGETENSDILVLKLCDHQTVGINNKITFPKVSFIFIKSKGNHSCPELQPMDVEGKTLQLDTEVNEVTELFDICYYRPDTMQTDIDNYLYMPQNSHPIIREPAFSILNPTLLYWNTTSTIMSSSQYTDFNRMLLLSNNQFGSKTTPWILVDLGRNFIVVGLQFTNYFLSECNSTDYLGTLNRTINGYVCQRWDKQEPHSHKRTGDEQFPEMTVSEAENYCRDPSKYGKIWCYTNSPSKRWDTCAEKVYNFDEDGIRFTHCFISEERWRLEEFGGISCQYRISYQDGQLYLNFYRRLEGRYVKLVGEEDVDNSKFYSATKHVTGMTTGKTLNDEIKCNTDLGMGDQSIQDHQITASSWKPQFPPASARPFSSGWCANTSDTNPYITIDMKVDTILEGITFFNWEIIDLQVDDGIYKKKYLPIGSKHVMVNFRTNDNKTYTIKVPNSIPLLKTPRPETVIRLVE